MQDGVVDNTERMKAIKVFLDSSEGGLEAKEQLLEELIEIVENIDYARGVQRLLSRPLLLVSPSQAS